MNRKVLIGIQIFLIVFLCLSLFVYYRVFKTLDLNFSELLDLLSEDDYRQESLVSKSHQLIRLSQQNTGLIIIILYGLFLTYIYSIFTIGRDNIKRFIYSFLTLFLIQLPSCTIIITYYNELISYDKSQGLIEFSNGFMQFFWYPLMTFYEIDISEVGWNVVLYVINLIILSTIVTLAVELIIYLIKRADKKSIEL